LETEIQVLKPQDLAGLNELISVFEDVFEREDFRRPSETHLQRLLSKDTFFAVVAKVQEKIIGGLTVYVLDQYYSEKPLAYLYDLAVLQAYQRKGVGRKLIEFTNDYCRQKGFEELFVQAERVDEHAIDFYRATQPTDEAQVVHFYYRFTDKPDPNT
jgi:aminoglycoside 3-N-acetyltransferase I